MAQLSRGLIVEELSLCICSGVCKTLWDHNVPHHLLGMACGG